MRPVSHSEDLPMPQHTENVTFSDDVSGNEVIKEVENPFHDPNFEASTSSEPHLLTQGDLNDKVRDLNLPKKQSELLGSRLKEWNLLSINTKVFFFRNRQDEFKSFFSQEKDLAFCTDVCSVLEVLLHENDKTEWRLFIDSSKVSLKAVLLHNGNKFPSVPLASPCCQHDRII
jgi:hypothetical protein